MLSTRNFNVQLNLYLRLQLHHGKRRTSKVTSGLEAASLSATGDSFSLSQCLLLFVVKFLAKELESRLRLELELQLIPK